MSLRARFVPALALLLAAACGGDSPSGPGPNPSPTPTPGGGTPPAVSSAGLVLLMHMDEAAWTGAANQVIDSSGSGHHGASVGSSTTNTAAGGRFGRAGSFPGGTGCVMVPDRADLRPDSALTISVWMNPNGVGAPALGVIAKRDNFLVNSAYAIYVDEQGRLGIDVDTEDNRFFTAPAVSNGRWTHLAIVYEGGSSRVTAYVNGSPAAASAVPGT